MFGDEGVAKGVVEMVGDMGRFAASPALRNALCDTKGVAWGVCD